jgi:hypothetical protein
MADGLIGKFQDWQAERSAFRDLNKGQGGGGFVEPRPRPIGIRNVKVDQNGQQVSFEVKTAVRFWWSVLPAVLVMAAYPFIFILAPIVGFLISPRDRYGMIQANLMPATVVAFVVIAIVAIVLACKATRPWVQMKATAQDVTVPRPFGRGVMRFDRRYFGGMRTGYSIQTEGGAVLKNSFMDGNFGLTGLRLSYGAWGEDLPYLVNGYHAAEIVIWMNMVMGGVDDATPKAHAPDVGIVEEVF